MYAIAGGKGGCGKTTTVCELASALVRAGQRPVVVDADVDMPDLHDRIDAAPEPGLDALAAGAPLRRVLQTDHDLRGAGVVATGDGSAVRDALVRLSALERPVLVDCPAGAGPDVAMPLGTADRAVVVSTDTRSSLEDAAKTAAMSQALDTPVACLCLRETAAGPASLGPDERLRRLVDAPSLVRVPTHGGNAGEAGRDGEPSGGCRTAALGRYDRMARTTVLQACGKGQGDALP